MKRDTEVTERSTEDTNRHTEVTKRNIEVTERSTEVTKRSTEFTIRNTDRGYENVHRGWEKEDRGYEEEHPTKRNTGRGYEKELCAHLGSSWSAPCAQLAPAPACHPMRETRCCYGERDLFSRLCSKANRKSYHSGCHVHRALMCTARSHVAVTVRLQLRGPPHGAEVWPRPAGGAKSGVRPQVACVLCVQQTLKVLFGPKIEEKTFKRGKVQRILCPDYHKVQDLTRQRMKRQGITSRGLLWITTC